MNILILSNKSAYQAGAFGGAESSMRLLAEHLVARGHSVRYIAKNRRGRIIPRVEAKRVQGVRLSIFHTTFGYRRIRPVQWMNDKLLERKVRALADFESIHLAYCFYELENLKLLLRVSTRNGTLRVVLRMAGVQWYERCLDNKRLINTYERLFSAVHAVNFISAGLRNMVHERLNELNMAVHFRYAFVLDIGTSRTPGRSIPYDQLAERPFKIIMATRFSRYQKRFDILVRAVAMMANDCNVELKLVGDGSGRPRIERLVNELGLVDRVTFAGFLPQVELWRELESAHLLTHPCDHEGLVR